LRIGIVNRHKHMVVEENQILQFRMGGLTPSCEMIPHRYMMGIPP
jgi:hypothetical protein